MRVLFLYMFPLWGNGSGSFLRELSSQLVKRGHTIGIISPDKRKLDSVIHYYSNSAPTGVFVGHPELPKARRFEDMSGKELGEIYASYLRVTINAVADFDPEIIHVFHTAYLPSIARIIKVIFGIKFIITTHGSDLNYLARDRRFIGLINDANRVARIITANSVFTKRWYLKMFGQYLKRKTRVIMGGVNLADYKRDPAMIAKIDEKFNLHGKKVVLFTGRLTKNKGVSYLVKAASSIKGTVVIVGDGPDRKNLEKEIKERKLVNVIMTGYINPSDDRMFHAFYERADVYVSSSVWEEPFGLTILEAMASRTPVVATKRGGVVSIIQDRVNGYFIRARNSKDIVKTVNMLLIDDVLRQKIGDTAYKTVEKYFTWDKIATQFEDIYKQFTYSTTEYLARVRGTNPKLSNAMRSINKFLVLK